MPFNAVSVTVNQCQSVPSANTNQFRSIYTNHKLVPIGKGGKYTEKTMPGCCFARIVYWCQLVPIQMTLEKEREKKKTKKEIIYEIFICICTTECIQHKSMIIQKNDWYQLVPIIGTNWW